MWLPRLFGFETGGNDLLETLTDELQEAGMLTNILASLFGCLHY
jgi:hypothetical protein